MATYYKRNVNTTNVNWNQADNWSTVSSASSTNAGTFPVAADTAILDSGSVSFTVNTASACTVLNMTGFAGTLTMTSTITASGAVTLGGTFAGTGALILSAAQTLTSNSVVIPTLTFTSNVTKTLTGDASVSGVMTVTGNTTLAGTGNLNTAGNLVMTGTITGRTITRTGGTWSGGGAIGSALTFNGNSTISGTVAFGTSTMTYTSGTITTTSSTLNINSTCTLNTGSSLVFNTINGNSTTATTVTLNNDLYCASITNIANNNLVLNTSTSKVVRVSGSFGHATNAGTWSGTAEILLVGTGTWSNTSLSVANNVTINTAGTITLGTCTITTNADIKYVAGTITLSSNNMRLNGNSTWDISTMPVRPSFSVAATTTMTLLSDLSAAAFINPSGVTLTMAGAFDMNVTTLRVSPTATLPSIIRIVAGRTITVADLELCGCAVGGTLNSTSAGTRFNLVYTGGLANAYVSGMTITDANITSPVKLYTWYGAVNNSTGIKAVTGANIGSAGVSVTQG